ncbi:MAG: hypothetical protein V1854_07050 [Methanobacteriota archaeon]
MTEEVTMQAQASNEGSSMYTSDGYLKSSRHNNKARTDSGAVATYQRVSVPHYYTVCEDNGRVVSIIEHN